MGATAAAKRTGALCGVVGVAAMTLVAALLLSLAEVPSPAELVGDRFGERVPVAPFLDLIGLVGTYGRLKALGVVGTLAVTLVASAVLGAVDARVSERQRNRLVLRATGGTGAIQTDKERSSGPEGATGPHKVTARIA